VRSVEPFLLYQHHTCALQGHGSAPVWRAVLISGRTPLVGAVPGDGFNFDVTEGALQIGSIVFLVFMHVKLGTEISARKVWTGDEGKATMVHVQWRKK
jgi:hypothetical protein